MKGISDHSAPAYCLPGRTVTAHAAAQREKYIYLGTVLVGICNYCRGG
jgi:hypothetical protein